MGAGRGGAERRREGRVRAGRSGEERGRATRRPARPLWDDRQQRVARHDGAGVAALRSAARAAGLARWALRPVHDAQPEGLQRHNKWEQRFQEKVLELTCLHVGWVCEFQRGPQQWEELPLVMSVLSQVS